MGARVVVQNVVFCWLVQWLTTFFASAHNVWWCIWFNQSHSFVYGVLDICFLQQKVRVRKKEEEEKGI